MIKKVIFVSVVMVVIFLADILFISVKNHSLHYKQCVEEQTVKVPHALTLFYSHQCPHCLIVEEFIEKNKVMQKIALEQKEVSDKSNLDLLIQAAKKCRLKTDTVGIPFLLDDSTCLTGDEQIIHYLKLKMHEK